MTGAAAPALRGALVLIGFMGAGKTTAASSAAPMLDAEAVDVDAEIERRAGKPVSRIFTEDGEAAFRAAEERITLELLADPATRVLALGGGGPTSTRVRDALRGHTVVWLDVDPAMAWQRVQGGERPLARDREAFERLHAERDPLYLSLADAIVPAASSPRALAGVIAALDGLPAGARLLWSGARSGEHPCYFGRGLLDARFWPPTIRGRRFLITDGQVGALHGGRLTGLAGRIAVMPGEASKTIAHAEIVWTEMVRAGVTRADVVVALGGGVVGDLAGFCAATYQRGMPVVQVPSTVVAQVDSAYGGKTGVDLPEAKNYIGAYHQPAAVITDPELLSTLPEEELSAGYAEIVKTALLAGGRLWDRVRGGAPPDDLEVILRCARTKLSVVAADERDHGQRQTLNLGHTLGHAIETVSGYARYRHGEAIGLGLLAALRLSGAEALREEVLELLTARRLPVTLDPSIDPEAVVSATALDKKRLGTGPVPFVLLAEPGAARTGCEVAPREVLAAVRELAGGEVAAAARPPSG